MEGVIMKAVVYLGGGPKKGMCLQEMEKPVPYEGEVLVKIHASSLNALDYRSMRMRMIPKRRIFGADIAGIVEAAGKDVHLFAIGDAVFGDIAPGGLGGLAEYAAVPESLLIRIPEGVSMIKAASLPVAGMTAIQALRDKGD